MNNGILKRAKIQMINPEYINTSPYQPRKNYDKSKMSGLVQSIRKNGIIQPLGVRKIDKNKYELIFGHRRLMASKILKMNSVPCIVNEIGDQNSFVCALIENIQREKLSFIEEAQAISRLITEYNLTQSEVSLYLGMTQPTIANKLRLLKLSSKQTERIENFSLTERHARALLRIADEKQRDDVLSEIIVRGLNVEQTDRFIDRLLDPKQLRPAEPTQKMIVKDLRLFINSINKAIKVMKGSGINVKSEKNEDENFIKYTVTIPKK